jgi:hypothetical protein
LSEALWIAALWQLVSSMLRARHLNQAIVRFVLISVQMFTGVATLFLFAPAALSIVHQVGPHARRIVGIFEIEPGNGWRGVNSGATSSLGTGDISGHECLSGTHRAALCGRRMISGRRPIGRATPSLNLI